MLKRLFFVLLFLTGFCVFREPLLAEKTPAANTAQENSRADAVRRIMAAEKVSSPSLLKSFFSIRSSKKKKEQLEAQKYLSTLMKDKNVTYFAYKLRKAIDQKNKNDIEIFLNAASFFQKITIRQKKESCLDYLVESLSRKVSFRGVIDKIFEDNFLISVTKLENLQWSDVTNFVTVFDAYRKNNTNNTGKLLFKTFNGNNRKISFLQLLLSNENLAKPELSDFLKRYIPSYVDESGDTLAHFIARNIAIFSESTFKAILEQYDIAMFCKNTKTHETPASIIFLNNESEQKTLSINTMLLSHKTKDTFPLSILDLAIAADDDLSAKAIISQKEELLNTYKTAVIADWTTAAKENWKKASFRLRTLLSRSIKTLEAINKEGWIEKGLLNIDPKTSPFNKEFLNKWPNPLLYKVFTQQDKIKQDPVDPTERPSDDDILIAASVDAEDINIAAEKAIAFNSYLKKAINVHREKLIKLQTQFLNQDLFHYTTKKYSAKDITGKWQYIDDVFSEAFLSNHGHSRIRRSLQLWRIFEIAEDNENLIFNQKSKVEQAKIIQIIKKNLSIKEIERAYQVAVKAAKNRDAASIPLLKKMTQLKQELTTQLKTHS